ncbi:MAG TPA: helix-turn-helix transcriptional regulator [Thermomicrobiales bacterium]|jgi:transcriptional regulator with XRE-family HTH domain
MNLEEYIADRAERDPAFRAAMEAMRPEYEFRRALIGARLAAGLTQTQLARAIGTRQPAIARLESGEARPSFDMLVRLAKALNVTFEISPIPSIDARPAPLAPSSTPDSPAEPATEPSPPSGGIVAGTRVRDSAAAP